MKNFRDVLTEFEARLQSLNLNEENSKEKIDKLSYIAIHHTQLASEFVQKIFKCIEMVSFFFFFLNNINLFAGPSR